jgi:hypothetical protein
VSMVNREPHEYAGCSSVGQLPLNVILGCDYTKKMLQQYSV